jgi:hypothetical protein
MNEAIDTPVAGPSAPEHSDNAVRERFNTAMQAVPPEQRGNIIVREKPNESTPTGSDTVGGETPKKDNSSQESDIPAEFLESTKPEVDEYDRITSEEQKGHITSEHWKNYKKLSKSKVDALTKELEEVKSKLPKDDFVPEKTAKQMEALQAKLKEYEDIVTRKHIQESPQFKEKFTSREQGIEKQIQKVAKTAGIDEDDVQAILNASEKKRYSLLGDIENEGARASIAALLNNRDMLIDEKTEFLAHHEKNTAQWEEEQKAQSDAQKAKQKELYDYAFNETLERLKKENFGPLRESKDRQDWNNEIKKDIELAKSMYDGVDFTPQRDAEMFIRAATAIRMQKIADNAVKRAVAAEKELAELKAAGPSASQAQDAKGKDKYEGMSSDQRAAATFREAQATASNGGFRR